MYYLYIFALINIHLVTRLNRSVSNFFGSNPHIPITQFLVTVNQFELKISGKFNSFIYFQDPCVKVSLLGKDGKKIKKKKTSTQKSTLNPVYNEEIVFTNLKRDQLDEILINFTVYHDSLTSRESLGTFMISSASRANDYVQWKNMIEGKKSIAWWHNLIPDKTSDTLNQSSRSNSYKFAKSINFSSLKIKS